MRKHLAVLALATGLAVATLVAPAQADHSWSNYHWATTSTGVPLQLGDNVDGSWQGYYDTAIKDWNSTTWALVPKAAVGGTTGKRCRASAGRVEVCNAAYGRNGWLGLAQVWVSGGHITQGTAKVNDTYFSMARYNNPSERQHVLCQEVGHTFGLGHTSEDGSSQNTCMDYWFNATDDGVSIRPNAHDFEQLGVIYNHLDATTTIGSTSTSAGAAPADARADWGREVERSADGHHATYLRDLGDGQRLVTHVIWAQDPRGEHVPHTHG